MNRRDVVTLFGIAVALPRAAFAQQKPLPVIGYFSARSAEAETPLRTPFLAALEQAGFATGRNVTIEYRFAEGRRDRLPMLATELVGLQPAVLVATEHGAALAAKAATTTVPIVFTSGYDSVQAGLVASLNRPGGNATGINLFTSELGPKRLALLRELLPEPGTIAVLIDRNSPSGPVQIEDVQTAARAIGQPILLLQVRNAEETEAAFATMAERRVTGLLYGASTLFQGIADRLVALAASQRLPALYEWRDFVIAGGLISYSTSRTEIGRQLGEYAGRILKGAAPADLPVVQSVRFELVINLKTAKALGLDLPASVLARADEMIE